MTIPAVRRMRQRIRQVVVLAAAGLAAAAIAPVQAADVVVFAAASLKEALDEQVQQFKASSGHRVVVSYGASGALARQIEAGAPADLFLSADVDWVDYLERRKQIVGNGRVDLLGNSLVLIAPRGSSSALKIAPRMPLADALGGGKLALANPESVPAGKYARAALQRLEVWSTVEKQVARTENVRVALALVARGEAAFGVVYGSDALAEPRVRVVDTFAETLHPPIVYAAALVARTTSPAARPLLDFLRSPGASGTWRKHGFSTR
jgi:molybdate transport system substrate-binding protein